jgi:predicted site-specific integrase-resolvase
MEHQSQFITVEQICKILDIKKVTVFSWVWSGLLTPIKPASESGRIHFLKLQISSTFPQEIAFQ